MAVDVHQHLWPAELVERLRARTEVPHLRGWTLHTATEAPFEVDPAHHEPDARVALDRDADVEAACVSLSAPLGLEQLPRHEAADLVDAWHRGARGLPHHFRAWASVTTVEPDLDQLAALLAEPRFVGLQLPATALVTPLGWEPAGGVLRVAELADKPVLVHPGPATPPAWAGGLVTGPTDEVPADLPGWWAPTVDYVQQLHAAWWAWHAAHARAAHPTLRVAFAAAAGLAPLHSERHALRGGHPRPVDPAVFVDTSGYGPRALDGVVRALGIDALVLGSDRPYASPLDAASGRVLGAAALHAVRSANPQRLLGWTPEGHDPLDPLEPQHPHDRKETPSWAFTS